MPLLFRTLPFGNVIYTGSVIRNHSAYVKII